MTEWDEIDSDEDKKAVIATTNEEVEAISLNCVETVEREEDFDAKELRGTGETVIVVRIVVVVLSSMTVRASLARTGSGVLISKAVTTSEA